MYPTVNALTDLAAPRPAGYGGPVTWLVPEGTAEPANAQATLRLEVAT